MNLHDRYAVLNEQRRVELRPDEYDDEVTVEIRVQPPTVWEWINDPRRRNEANVEDGVNWSARRRPGGRTAVGATNHCDHGGGTADEQILDWKPFEYYSSSFKSGPLRLIMTWELQAIPDGTRLTWRGKVEQKMPRFLARLIMKKGVKGDVILGKIKSAIETDVATAEGKV